MVPDGLLLAADLAEGSGPEVLGVAAAGDHGRHLQEGEGEGQGEQGEGDAKVGEANGRGLLLAVGLEEGGRKGVQFFGGDLGSAEDQRASPSKGASVVPRELKACEKLRRLAAVFSGPRLVT